MVVLYAFDNCLCSLYLYSCFARSWTVSMCGRYLSITFHQMQKVVIKFYLSFPSTSSQCQVCCCHIMDKHNIVKITCFLFCFFFHVVHVVGGISFVFRSAVLKTVTLICFTHFLNTVLLLWFISFVGKPKSPDVDKAFRRSSPADSIRGLSADEQTKDKVNALGFG